MAISEQAPPFKYALARFPMVRRFFSFKSAQFGVGGILILAAASMFGPALLPYDHLYIDLLARFAPPMHGGHMLGTDDLGRDLLARLLMAGRISLVVGLLAMVISITLGAIVGGIAGYYRGYIGAILMRITDAFLCFPQILLLVALAAFVTPTVVSISVIIAATSWMEVARLMEGQTRAISQREFAVAARVLGASDFHIIFREILPNAAGPILVAASVNVASAILMESYVSFLGYGIQPPTPSWGNMLEGAQQYLSTAPWMAFFPGLIIVLAVLSFSLVGDALRKTLDPRTK